MLGSAGIDGLHAVFNRYTLPLETQSAMNTVTFIQWMFEIDKHDARTARLEINSLACPRNVRFHFKVLW